MPFGPSHETERLGQKAALPCSWTDWRANLKHSILDTDEGVARRATTKRFTRLMVTIPFNPNLRFGLGQKGTPATWTVCPP